MMSSGSRSKTGTDLLTLAVFVLLVSISKILKLLLNDYLDLGMHMAAIWAKRPALYAHQCLFLFCEVCSPILMYWFLLSFVFGFCSPCFVRVCFLVLVCSSLLSFCFGTREGVPMILQKLVFTNTVPKPCPLKHRCYVYRLSTLRSFVFFVHAVYLWPPLWSSAQRSRVRFSTLPHFLRSTESGTGSTQSRENNWATWTEKWRLRV
jgi:hypothetical protein